MKSMLTSLFAVTMTGFVPHTGICQADILKSGQENLGVFTVGDFHVPEGFSTGSDFSLKDKEKLPLIVLSVDASRSSDQDLADEIHQYTSDGHAILEIHHNGLIPDNISTIGEDLLAIRKWSYNYTETYPVDPDRTFFMPVGHRLEKDVAFYTAWGYDYVMDIRYPAVADEVRPIILQITHKTDCRSCFRTYNNYDDSLLDALSVLGYTVAYADHYGSAFLDYDKVDWMPVFVHPPKAAVQFLRQNAGKYRIDSERIIALGFSKGGTAAAMLAVTADEPQLELGGLYNEISSEVLAAVVIGAHLDLRSLKADAKGIINDRWDNPYAQWGDPEESPKHWIEGSATTYVSPGDSPMLLIGGELDSHRPYQAKRMKDKLDSVGVANTHITVPGLKHSIPKDKETMNAVASFVQNMLK